MDYNKIPFVKIKDYGTLQDWKHKKHENEENNCRNYDYGTKHNDLFLSNTSKLLENKDVFKINQLTLGNKPIHIKQLINNYEDYNLFILEENV